MTESSISRGSAPKDLSNRDHRRLIGVLGLLLPLLLYLIAGLRPMHVEQIRSWRLLNSVSSYYHTGAVAIFVGVLFALALFLVTYQGYGSKSPDRAVGRIGGAAALGVALFPCEAPTYLVPPPWWNETFAVIHYVSAVTLFISFILFAIWLFRKTGGPKSARDRYKRGRDHVCLACGIVMIVAVLWAGSSMFTHAPIFVPESIAIVAFAVSWLVKGEAPPVAQVVRFVSEKLLREQGVPDESAPARKAS